MSNVENIYNANELFRYYQNVVKMMRDREYKVKGEITDEKKFEEMYKKDKYIMIYDVEGKISVNINKNLKFKKAYFDTLIKRLDTQKVILVTSGSISGATIKAKDAMVDQDIEFYNIDEFLFDKPRHKLVPPHFLIKKGEIDKKLKGMDIKNFPDIKIGDPIAKWYGAQVGDVFKIIRKSTDKIHDTTKIFLGTNPNEVYYRKVTK